MLQLRKGRFQRERKSPRVHSIAKPLVDLGHHATVLRRVGVPAFPARWLAQPHVKGRYASAADGDDVSAWYAKACGSVDVLGVQGDNLEFFFFWTPMRLAISAHTICMCKRKYIFFLLQANQPPTPRTSQLTWDTGRTCNQTKRNNKSENHG